MVKIADIDFQQMWIDDKYCIIDTMYNNILADLDAGYDPKGKSITDQKNAVDEYIRKFNSQLDKFVTMTDTEVNRWCYYDLLKRGAIIPINA